MAAILRCAILLFLFNARNVLTLYNKPRIVERRDEVKYDPNWDSLDTRPLPTWFDEDKIGIFLHWGVFSVPSFGGEWFWSAWDSNTTEYVEFMKKNYPPNFTYQDFAKDFKAEFFNPDEWAELFEKAGAKYVVLTSKHHEGYTMWPSRYSFGWNVNDVGPHRDLLGDLAKAVGDRGLKFGLYHSLYEWYNPMYIADQESNFTQKEFVLKKMLPEMYELVNTYKPWVFWSDGDWEAYDTYFNSLEFLSWLYNESPVKDVVVVNDRWGIDIPCNHGDFYSCKDRYNPGVLQPHKWENAMTVDKDSWGFRREANISNYLTTAELIQTLAQTISCGGNLLINVGPTKEGTIVPIFQERLLDLGQWLKVNGEAVYKSKPWTFQNDTKTGDVWYTSGLGAVYAIALTWPQDNTLQLESPQELFRDPQATVTLLGIETVLSWKVENGLVLITFPDKAVVKSDWAWVLKIAS